MYHCNALYKLEFYRYSEKLPTSQGSLIKRKIRLKTQGNNLNIKEGDAWFLFLKEITPNKYNVTLQLSRGHLGQFEEN